MINPRDDIRVEFDTADFQLPGWPGYRTRPGRSGYDALDYQYEFSHFQGRVIMSFLKRDWHTENLLYLVLLNLFSLFSLFFGLMWLYSYIRHFLYLFEAIGLQGTAGLIITIVVIYSIIWLGFREIDTIVETENSSATVL